MGRNRCRICARRRGNVERLVMGCDSGCAGPTRRAGLGLATGDQKRGSIVMADASYVAYHEAGHAIVDVLLGHRFDAVYVYEKSTLVRGNWYVGLVDGDPDAVYFRRDNAVAALAGPVAEARYTGKTRDDAFRNKLGAGECADV